jgi:hypothetical protein
MNNTALEECNVLNAEQLLMQTVIIVGIVEEK